MLILFEEFNQINENFNKNVLIEYYNELCKLEKIDPLPIRFGKVAKLGAAIYYNSKTMLPSYIIFEINKISDLEFALYHEFAHQICILKYKEAGHGAKFKKEFNRINDKYMYSNLSMKYLSKLYENVKRFDIGSKLTDAEKREVYKTMQDAYKVLHRPYTIEENQYGRDKMVWLENAYDYMVTSDITKKRLRWFIQLPDGKLAHPTELYINIKKSEIDAVQTNLEYYEHQSFLKYDKVLNLLKKNNEVESLIESIDIAFKNNFEFKIEYNGDDIGKKDALIYIINKQLNIAWSIPEYHINRGGSFCGLTEEDLIKYKNGIKNVLLSDSYCRIDWKRFYEENK